MAISQTAEIVNLYNDQHLQLKMFFCMKQHLHKFHTLYITIAVLVAASVFLYNYPPGTIVDYIGIENSYITVFLIAVIGGLSSITSGVYYAAVATFASGGANPWLLGLTGGIGIAIGDSIIFGLFAFGLRSISQTWQSRIETVSTYIDHQPRWLVYVVLFLILGVSPLPNDIVMLALVLLQFKYLKIAPVLVAAGISITIITAFLGESLFSYIL